MTGLRHIGTPALAAAALALAAGWGLHGGPATAAGPGAKQRAAVLQAIVDCRAMTDEHARLACYDAAAARLDEAEAKGQVVVVDREQAREVRKEVFGLQLPSLDIFHPAGRDGAAEEDFDRIDAVVKSASQAGPGGRWVFELDNGAVWRQIDNYGLNREPRPGSKVEIRKAALGSFKMKVDGQPAIRVHRDR
jgi:hypothetical protein